MTKSVLCKVFDSLKTGEDIDFGHSEITTVGDLWKSLSEIGKSAEHGRKYSTRAEAMRSLIAKLALAEDVDRRTIVNMTLACFDRMLKHHSLQSSGGR